MNEKIHHQEQEPLPNRYETIQTKKEQTGLRLFGIKDKQTGVTTFFAELNPEFDAHSALAWSGARASRNEQGKSFAEIFAEIYEASQQGRYTAGKKLSNVFVNYGHASVADMAPVMIFADQIPMHEAFWVFNHTSVGAGQELSTRYVQIEDLGVSSLHELLGSELAPQLLPDFEKDWKVMQDYLADHYKKWSQKLREPLETFLKQRTEQPISKKTIDARVFDVARMWIPAGARTSMALLSSARSFVDIASQLRSSGNYELTSLGDQIVTLLKLKNYEDFDDIQAELGDLTKYHEGSDVLRKNLQHLKQYALAKTHIASYLPKRTAKRIAPQATKVTTLEKTSSHGELLLLQHLLAAFPDAALEKLKSYIEDLDEEQLKGFGQIIFANHTHHELMRNAADHRGAGFLIETALAYHRDFNRHRAMGRLAIELETPDFSKIVGNGPNKNYQLAEALYWREFEQEWVRDMKGYYEQLYAFQQRLDTATGGQYDQRILFNMFPLGHQMNMLLSGPISQWQYFTSLRIGHGGDFGYRKIAWDLLEKLRQDPVLEAMCAHLKKPDPNDVEQILGRS